MGILGIDVGFGFTKATDGNKTVIFKSVLGESYDIQFYSSFGKDSFADSLHVTIDDNSYFIGDFAEQQSSVRQFTLDQETLISDYVKILALTAAGSCYKESASVNVVSGLPISYFRRDYKRFSELLTGHNRITFHSPDGKNLLKTIYIQKVQMVPQPIGSIFNLLMNDNGRIVNKELSKQKVGVVDIGFRTTDFTVFDHLRYIERGSSTLDTGISKCFSVISNRLREESGVSVELYRLYKAVEAGSIKIKGQEYTISNFRDKVYVHLAGVIANEINRLWAEDWDIDNIVLTGGGCMELADHLKRLIDGNVIPVENNIDARLNNVQGYVKFGKYLWGQTVAETTASEAPSQQPKEPPDNKVNSKTTDSGSKGPKLLKK
jgi:plasmid segregation protein ParM